MSLEQPVKTRKALPNWWYVFVADLRVRVSRFRFLKGFRYFLPFIIFILFMLQFALTFASSGGEVLIENFESFSSRWLFIIESVVVAFIIFLAFNTSLSYFAQNTELSELEIVSCSPISTRSYLFGKYLSLQLNNIILIPVLMLLHIELANLGGVSINWWFFAFYFIIITILFLSISWLGITLGPRTVFRMGQKEEGKKDRRSILMLLVNLFVAIQLGVPILLAFILGPEQFELGFKYLPYGWFAMVGKEIYVPSSTPMLPVMFGLLTLLFSSIFIFVAYIRTNFSLNIENFETLTGVTTSKTKTPRTLKILERLPLPYKYSVKAFYLMNYRKNSFNRVVDYFFGIALIGLIIVGFVFPQYNWSFYILAGSLVAGVMLTAMASTDGLQILFGAKNTFLVCQSAPQGIRKLLIGKVVQIFITYLFQFACFLTILLVFHENKLDAILVTIMIISAIFSGLCIGLFSLSIAPFFETADITANPIRGLQIAMPLNINFLMTGGVIIGFIFLFGDPFIWYFYLLMIGFFLFVGFLYLFFAEKLLKRFQG